ncbi:non-hydrolyzing UDP-N-acetylglucosamine 2-epimerase [Oceanobacillus sp. Castelsardo]|uniref:non-hydrolyzing UDP-N-acetylglucosamine 2-epimerase n=1 Tax=Oceanobacillus sp. Castelsardo TaxID=1851204 RepID=UPI000838B379|nr:UDP-N-acetylglucosamine 2-epimerase (non-hydrolyzing) [Oceanobacillus sp. Castelsardo]
MKILTVVGARPQFIKASMLSKEFEKDSNIKEILVHTGQHYDADMSDVFFEQLKIPKPDYHLGIGSGTHGKQTGKMLSEIESILLKEKPDMVLVYGDTNSTLAGSLAASKLHIPIAHVEAGLRSFNKKMPEEINRLLTDHLSTWLFCPTKSALNNLRREGIKENVFITGDIMYDAVLHYKYEAIKHSTILTRLNLVKKDYYLVTIHRAENTDRMDRLKTLLTVLSQLDRPVVLPLHPRTKKKIEHWGLGSIISAAHIHTITPLDYFDMLTLESEAKIILTDSGGVQKEAYMLRVPCITLRDETEWIETVEAKWNSIVGADQQKILKEISDKKEPNSYPMLFGDGKTSGKIYKIISGR